MSNKEAEAIREFLEENRPRTSPNNPSPLTYKELALKAKGFTPPDERASLSHLSSCLTPGEVRCKLRSNTRYSVETDPSIAAMMKAMRLEDGGKAELMNLLTAFQARVLEEMQK